MEDQKYMRKPRRIIKIAQNRSYFFILLTISIQLLLWLPRSDSRTNTNSILRNVSKFVFGDLWRFSEYCNNQRNDSLVNEDDYLAQKLFNLTTITSIEVVGGTSTRQRLGNLILFGARSRHTITAVCSVGAWGYADETTYEASNQPFADPDKCASQVDNLYQTLTHLELAGANQENSTETQIDKDALVQARAYGQQAKMHPHVLNWLKITANARIPVGPLFQDTIWPGDYSSCVHFKDMRYCLGSFGKDNWARDSRVSSNAIRVGLCLPRNCNSKSLKKTDLLQKIDSLLKYNLADMIGFTDSRLYRLRDIHCPPAEDSAHRYPFRGTLPKVLLGLLILWISAIIYVASFSDKPTSNKFMKGFDLGMTWRKFLESEHVNADLVGLNSVKVIGAWWLLVTHMYVLTGTSYTANVHDLRSDWRRSFLGAWINQGQHAVPMFFLMSGILVGHKYLGKQPDLFKFIGCRYVRLLPMYLLVYTFIKTFGHQLSSGPLWDFGVSPESEARQCMLESWFVPLLMLANFIPPMAHCVLTGWHVANDFQIYLTLPLLLYAYRRSRSLGRLVAITSFVASHLYHAYNFSTSPKFIFDHLHKEPTIFGASIILDRMSFDYVNPLGRLGTYFFGVFLSDILFHTNDETTKIANTTVKQSDKTLIKLNRSSDGSWLELNKKADWDGERTVNGQQPVAVVRSMTSRPQDMKATTNEEWSLFGHVTGQLVSLVTTFKNQIAGLVGAAMVNIAISAAIWSDKIKDSLGHYGWTAYPLVRFFIELGSALILYWVLADNRAQKDSSIRLSKLVKEKGVHVDENNNHQMDGQLRSGSREPTMLSSSTSKLDSRSGYLLSSTVWNVVVKLNYCVILVHFSVARYVVQSQTQLINYTWLNFFQLTGFVAILTYLISFVLHLTVEVPLMSLVNILTSAITKRIP